ncbi:isopentenyl-diphosphate Delta-isomerase [Nocardiopsis ansamitocini]|uniref:Isopentenyl-diphosphate Delta-isomerase n=1 Tax=Nocardiopsis ansamitocini TaxID=1670832 RepID=A0A9W6UHC7_9ACTN|nr:isopentenyl-diphosphate Delta-isomerase [Nocardiopsis ansamitocini]
MSEDLSPIGEADKATVHTGQTPLHLAFSCYVRDAQDRILVTRRALCKKTWPGVWTNSFCGHPAPGEDRTAAVYRRARTELGLELESVRLVLPDFRYRAVSAEGIVENEFCPVYTAVAGNDPLPDPDEVAEYRWVSWTGLARLAEEAPWSISPWAAIQVPLLDTAAQNRWKV